MNSLTISLDPVIHLSDEQFFDLCQHNSDLRFERNSYGDITIMVPESSDTGLRNFEIAADLAIWNRKYKLGVAFGSSAGFTLPNGAVKSPDAAWILKSRWEALTLEQQCKFAPICPDFVMELMSKSDVLKITQSKMQEYQYNGTRLGWLINRQDQTVEIYRLGQEVEILSRPNNLNGEDVLPKFILNLENIW
jgi:Uma2 family endonuclease